MIRITVLSIKEHLIKKAMYNLLMTIIYTCIMYAIFKVFLNIELMKNEVENNLLVYSQTNKENSVLYKILNNEIYILNEKNNIKKNQIVEKSNNSNEDVLEKNLDIENNLLNKEYIIKKNEISIKNKTNYEIDYDLFLNKKLNLMRNKDEDNILIIHTHGSESYLGCPHTDYYRNENSEYNVIKVGAEIEKTLIQKGYKVIHDTSLYDYPTYNGSYTRSLEKIEYYLEKEKIDIVFDIHRDAMGSDEFYAPKTQINNQDVAQIMIIAGTDEGGLEHKNWKENLSFAVKLQNVAEQVYPGLLRPLNITTARYNQHTTTGTLLLEVGATGNTMEECILAMKYFAEVIDITLKNY